MISIIYLVQCKLNKRNIHKIYDINDKSDVLFSMMMVKDSFINHYKKVRFWQIFSHKTPTSNRLLTLTSCIKWCFFLWWDFHRIFHQISLTLRDFVLHCKEFIIMEIINKSKVLKINLEWSTRISSAEWIFTFTE